MQGREGKLQSHEVYFGALEFIPVIITLALSAAWHPGRCIQRGSVSGTKMSRKDQRDGGRV
jgi:hypothetical protein